MNKYFKYINNNINNLNKFLFKKIYILNFLIFIILFLLITYIIISFYKNLTKNKIKVGILFTTSKGAMAKNEKRLYDIVNETIDLYNNLQNKIYLEKYSYNPESSTEKYVEGAEELLKKDVALVFGCWRSVDRKAILPIFEKYDNILNYSVQYEGLECCKNILYYGACPNQQINIGIEYGIKNISSKIVLIGSDYIFPRTANNIMKEYIKKYNASLLDEIYVNMDETKFDNIIEKIISKYKNEPVLIMNTINGESNIHFFKALYEKFKSNKENKMKICSNYFPVVSFSVTECDCFELFNIEYIYGHYFVWNYSQLDKSYDKFLEEEYNFNPILENKIIKNIIKNKKEIIDDPMYHAFLSVLFFIHFLESYNGNYTSKNIRNNYFDFVNKNINILTPNGYLHLNDNNHLEQPCYILKINKDKRFESVYKTPIEIHPNPWYNKFSKVHYECNNYDSFLGDKYISYTTLNY
jgi:urea transport system substrate-binding protein